MNPYEFKISQLQKLTTEQIIEVHNSLGSDKVPKYAIPTDKSLLTEFRIELIPKIAAFYPMALVSKAVRDVTIKTVNKADALISNMTYLKRGLSEEELNAIDDILCSALVRLGGESADRWEKEDIE